MVSKGSTENQIVRIAHTSVIYNKSKCDVEKGSYEKKSMADFL